MCSGRLVHPPLDYSATGRRRRRWAGRAGPGRGSAAPGPGRSAGRRRADAPACAGLSGQGQARVALVVPGQAARLLTRRGAVEALRAPHTFKPLIRDARLILRAGRRARRGLACAIPRQVRLADGTESQFLGVDVRVGPEGAAPHPVAADAPRP